MCGDVGFKVEGTGGQHPLLPQTNPGQAGGGRYIGPILLVSLADLVTGRLPVGGSAPKGCGGGGGGSGNKKTLPKVAATGGTAQVKVRYDAHLPSLSLHGGLNSCFILTRAVLPTLHGHVICKN